MIKMRGLWFFWWLFMRSSRHDNFHSLGQIPARKKDPVPASLALDADVSSQSDDRPILASARMRFAQAEDIAEAKIRKHAAIIPIQACDEKKRHGRIRKAAEMEVFNG
jgi:hypothetical protein